MRRLAAIMFADFNGEAASMPKDEQVATALRKTYRKHFSELIDKYRGKILPHYGDGTLSTFMSVQDAIKCSIDLQRAYRASSPPIPLGIGIHLGEVVQEKRDSAGDDIHLVFQIARLAVPGSVLISDTVYHELKNCHGIEVSPLGNCRQESPIGPVEVFAVADPDLEVPEHAALKEKMKNSGERVLDLPGYPNAFIGRSHHLYSLSSLLREENNRLITLLGPGGMGKTRLSVRVGEELAGFFAHGVCFVPLDTVVDHRQVPRHIGNRLGIRESRGRSWLAASIRFLADRHLLLILDNLEQILESGEVILEILESCPQVSILATSREVLRLRGEVEYPLDSLNRPNPRTFSGTK